MPWRLQEGQEIVASYQTCSHEREQEVQFARIDGGQEVKQKSSDGWAPMFGCDAFLHFEQ